MVRSPLLLSEPAQWVSPDSTNPYRMRGLSEQQWAPAAWKPARWETSRIRLQTEWIKRKPIARSRGAGWLPQPSYSILTFFLKS
jgi:hypothetical protein